MGKPITIVEFLESGKEPKKTVLGNDFEEVAKGNQVPFYTVKGGVWFGSYVESYDSENEFSLCGCTVTPGFEFADGQAFEKDKTDFVIPQEYDFLVNKLL